LQKNDTDSIMMILTLLRITQPQMEALFAPCMLFILW